MRRTSAVAAGVALAVGLGAPAASAFCGFYVSGADTKLYNHATQVVLLRDGVRTVLSMANNYQGPPEGFAMVVPVPVVLQKENVKTLPSAVFDRVDRLTAPRLVEYWEEDPCDHGREHGWRFAQRAAARASAPAFATGAPAVRVEAEFTVSEYEIVILSADDSTALDAWLRQSGYRIPPGAEPVLRPYVARGSKFFVAKVDARKVRFEGGMATLSPLRFHYDDDRFDLPVRLGLLNSSGVQDLIVQILSRAQRFEVANYPNVTVPTNIELNEAALSSFGSFYVDLFDRTVRDKPGAVVTEYAWAAGTCDPCPGPSLSEADLSLLGGEVVHRAGERPLSPWDTTITRLHVRYTKDSLGEDLVFRAAPPIEGGTRNTEGSHAARPASGTQSTFQGRYIVRHPWDGPVRCVDPQMERWGERSARAEGAKSLAFAPREGSTLSGLPAEDVPEVGLKGTPPAWRHRIFRTPLYAHLFTWPGAVVLGIAAGISLLRLLIRWERRAP
jgi:hypothetical protein